MQKLIYLVLLIFIFSILPVQAQTDLEQFNLRSECFRRFASLIPERLGTVAVSVYPSADIFFVQNSKVLENRLFNDEEVTFIDYKVIDAKGVNSSWTARTKFLNDNNSNSKFSFTGYNNSTKSLTIDLREVVEPDSINLNINIEGVYRPSIFISENNIEFIEVADLRDFSFQYIRIEMKKIPKDQKVYPLAIKELNFLKKSKAEYLVNVISDAKLYVYADYRCENEVLQKLKIQENIISRQADFAINADTEKINVDLGENLYFDSDFDDDGVENEQDNCPFVKNSEQKDYDKDLIGDECDLDKQTKNPWENDYDKDGIGDSNDNCPYDYNPKQQDSNADKRGDICADDDRDGIIGKRDNCILIKNKDQADVNNNGVGDACEFDKDGDGIFDSIDNCINKENNSQSDADKDGIGDVCDNCKLYNPRQIDKDGNNVGDVCTEKNEYAIKNDKDGDEILNARDNCPEISNPEQADQDDDKVGDICDNCPNLKNIDQLDKNKNNIGDLCEDIDSDGLLGYQDNCPEHNNRQQKDQDNDGIGDACEDKDRDGLVFAQDNCPYNSNPDQNDVDDDGVGDVCDEKDDRIVESNQTIFKIFIAVVALVFIGLIIVMARKGLLAEKEDDSDLDEVLDSRPDDNRTEE